MLGHAQGPLNARRFRAGGKAGILGGMDSPADIETHAQAGDNDAWFARGRQLLSSPPPVTRQIVDEGRRLILAAADGGHAEAAYYVALTSAIDRSLPHNWVRALNYLERAALAGHAPALAELTLLAGEAPPDASTPAENIRALRQRAHPANFLKKHEPRIVSQSPLIAQIPGFATPALCDWLIRSTAERMSRAETYNPADGNMVANHSAAAPETDLVLVSILQRISNLTGVAINGMERTSVLRYTPGEDFKPHYDFLDPAKPALAGEIMRTGQRVFTFLVYLNDDFEGGETHFTKLGQSFKGRKGDALLFRNVTPQGYPDFQTEHAGLPPTSGEKWLFARTCTFIPQRPR